MPPAQINIIPTNIPGLDQILGGGIPLGSLIMTVGAPGTGKTILLQQIAFAWAKKQAQSNDDLTPNGRKQKPGKVLYFSTLSEPHDKMLHHLRQFSFFDESALYERLSFLSLTSIMDEGLDSVRKLIVDTTRIEQAQIVIIDSFAPLASLAATPDILRRCVYQLSSQLGLLNATTFISIERTLGNSISEDELALADGIIGLFSSIEGVREYHRIEIRKLRGMPRLRGMHTYRITDEGLSFYPRFEELADSELNYRGVSPHNQRLKLGLPEFENMLHGGIAKSSSTIIAGSLGTGKTLLTLHYLLAGAAIGERGFYVGFHESRDELFAKAEKFSLKLREAVDNGMIRLLTLSPVQAEPDIVGMQIRAEIELNEVTRFVFDGYTELEQVLSENNRSLSFTAALVIFLKKHSVTALFTHEIQKIVGLELDLSDTPFTRIAENLILLRHVEYKSRLYRVLSILKMRDSTYDSTIHEFVIQDNQGIVVLQPMESASGLLTGLARHESKE